MNNSYQIQAILFNNTIFDTKKARKWLKTHNFQPIKKVHKTENYLRYRIIYPNKNYDYITKQLNNRIILVLMKQKMGIK